MKLAIIPLVIACSVPFAFAENQRHKGPNIERLTESLQLSEEQVADVEAIFADHHQARSKSKELRREERSAQRAATRERLAGVLSEQQLSTFDEMREQRRGKHKRRGMRENRQNLN